MLARVISVGVLFAERVLLFLASRR